jgi:hypothetical protein
MSPPIAPGHGTASVSIGRVCRALRCVALGSDVTIVAIKRVEMPSSYVVSDLARQRREVVDAARREPVLIRDVDGLMLVMQTQDRDLVTNRILDYYELHTRAEIECRSAQPNSAVLGELAFVAEWVPAERQAFLDGLGETLDECRRLGSLEPATFYIRWHAPTEGPVPTVIDPQFTKRFGVAIQRHLNR